MLEASKRHTACIEDVVVLSYFISIMSGRRLAESDEKQLVALMSKYDFEAMFARFPGSHPNFAESYLSEVIQKYSN